MARGFLDDGPEDVKLVDVRAQEVRRSDAGILLACDEWPDPVWFPLSEVEVYDDGTVAIPEWLLRERNLL